MRLWKAIALTLVLVIARLGAAGEAPTLDQIVAELTGKAPMSERTKAKLRATCNSVLDILLPKLAGKDLDAREQAQITLKRIGWHAARPGADAERQTLARAICGKISPQMPQPVLVFLLRQLETLGGEESVEAVAALLEADPLARERARITLEVNPCPRATDALRAALRKPRDPDWTVALINALGARGDDRSVPDLLKHAASQDEAVRLAACDALAAIGDARGAGAIARATRMKNSKATLHAIGRAYLRLADQFCARGDKARALGMYRDFLDSVPYLRCAAIIGLGRAGGADEIPTLFQALEADSAEIRAAGRAALELLPVEAVRQAIAARAKTADPQMLVQLLGILAQRGGTEELATFVSASKHASEDVRVAAYRGMASIASAQAVPTLLVALAQAEGRALDAVRNAVGSIHGEAADQALIQAMGGPDPKLRVEIIRLLADRSATSAVPSLLEAAKAKDPKVREAAFAALGTLAGADALPSLVGLLLDAPGKADHEAAAEAVVAAAGRVEDETKRGAPVVAALSKADEAAVRVALVHVLGRMGGGTALEAIRQATRSDDAAVKDAAIRALADWQNAKVAADLLRIASDAKTLVHHVLALRGYVRVASLPGERPASGTLAMLDKAMSVTRRVNEKKLVLGAVAEVAHAKALEMARPYLTDPALASEAAIATARVAQAISGTEREAAKVALEKLLEVSEDKEARQLAQKTLDEIHKYADYVTAWEVAGPYTKPGKQGPALHNEKLPPEEPDKQATWTTMPPGGNEPKLPYLMDLYKRFKKENCVAYLRTNLWSPEAQEATLEFGSDDGVKVWLNGKLILNVAQPRSFKEAENKAKVSLKQGWNPLLVKVWNGGKWWSAAARFRGPDGSRIEGLRASIKAE